MITLKTLSKATTQEVFDQVASHMLTQMKKSDDTDGACFYRHPNGTLKCAAGALISDDEYNIEWDIDGGMSWSALVKRGFATPEHEHLISSLQLIHDNQCVEEWELSLIDLANNFDLEFKF